MTEGEQPFTTPALRDYFGTRLTPVNFSRWLQSIEESVASGSRRLLFGHHNLQSLYLLQSDAVVKAFYARCDACYIDGTPIKLVLAGAGIGKTPRFTLMDCFPDLLAHAERLGWRVFYLGSKPEVVERAQQRIRREYPGLNIQLHSGYLEDSGQVVEAINRLSPHLLLVGMGMPRQEAWLLQHLGSLDVVVATQSGGTLDYFVGAQAKPPLWLSRAGLAWLYRLAHDPVRLWKRYLLEPWGLLVPTLQLWLSRQ